jgi:hypothetical protein
LQVAPASPLYLSRHRLLHYHAHRDSNQGTFLVFPSAIATLHLGPFLLNLNRISPNRGVY